MTTRTPIESILKKDRALVLAGVVALIALAWAYMFYLAWDMQRGMGETSIQTGMNLALTQVRAWTGVDFLLMFLMWAVMMTAMMVPTAAPMILTFATINRRRLEQQQPFVPTSVFLLGYLIIWSAFAAAATAAQWGLNIAALLSPNGQHQPIFGRRPPAGGGPIPVESHQIRLPQPLPHSHGLHHD